MEVKSMYSPMFTTLYLVLITMLPRNKRYPYRDIGTIRTFSAISAISAISILAISAITCYWYWYD